MATAVRVPCQKGRVGRLRVPPAPLLPAGPVASNTRCDAGGDAAVRAGGRSLLLSFAGAGRVAPPTRLGWLDARQRASLGEGVLAVGFPSHRESARLALASGVVWNTLVRADEYEDAPTQPCERSPGDLGGLLDPRLRCRRSRSTPAVRPPRPLLLKEPSQKGLSRGGGARWSRAPLGPHNQHAALTALRRLAAGSSRGSALQRRTAPRCPPAAGSKDGPC